MDRLQKAVARAKEKKDAKEINESRSVKDGFGGVDFSAVRTLSVSDKNLAEKRIVAGLSDAALQERQTFRLLRTKVLSEMKANDWHSIAICAPGEGEGKSTVAANLAVAMCMEVTQSVLLVDLDLREPSLHQAFGLDVRVGLSDFLRGDADIADTLINPGIDRLTLIPGRGVMHDSSEHLSGHKMVRLFADLDVRYKSRFVVFVLPPIDSSDDVLKTIANFDCSLLVLEDGKNTASDIREAISVLKHTNYLGSVLNKSDTRFLLGSQE